MVASVSATVALQLRGSPNGCPWCALVVIRTGNDPFIPLAELVGSGVVVAVCVQHSAQFLRRDDLPQDTIVVRLVGDLYHISFPPIVAVR